MLNVSNCEYNFEKKVIMFDTCSAGTTRKAMLSGPEAIIFNLLPCLTNNIDNWIKQ